MSTDLAPSGRQPPCRGIPGIRYCAHCKRPIVGYGHPSRDGFDYHKVCLKLTGDRTAGTHYRKEQR